MMPAMPVIPIRAARRETIQAAIHHLPPGPLVPSAATSRFLDRQAMKLTRAHPRQKPVMSELAMTLQDTAAVNRPPPVLAAATRPRAPAVEIVLLSALVAATRLRAPA